MTPCDLVFPFFLYIMGISTFLSLRKFGFKWSPAVARKIAKRTILIFLIGLGINWLSNVVGGDWGLGHLRIMAVLQRIALCYCAVSLLALFVNHKYSLHIAIGLLAIYTVILLLGNGYATDASNIALCIDKAILGGNHLYTHSPIDPEGLLGTIPAIAHTLIGFWCGRAMSMKDTTIEKVMCFLLVGAILVFGGYLLSYGLPLNKTIWSPSFVLTTTGLASLLQGILMYVIDIRHFRRLITLFLVFGVNPLFLYVLSEALSIVCWKTGWNGMLYNGIYAMVNGSCRASLCFALTHVVVCWAVGWPLYKRKIFIKI
jgi:predicted acyltransferase